MKDDWIPIDKMTPPTGANCKFLMFTPTPDLSMQYRVVPADVWKTVSDATHWQPCIEPKTGPANSHTCSTCGTEHKWPNYVLAHWDEALNYTCKQCGERVGIMKGIVTIRRGGKIEDY